MKTTKTKRKVGRPAGITTTHQKLSPATLQSVLWDTLQGVISGDFAADSANSVATNAREITRIAKLRLDVAKFKGAKTVTGDRLLGNF